MKFDFATGHPSSDLFPSQIISQATNILIQNPILEDSAFNYGDDPGNLEVLKNLATWMNSHLPELSFQISSNDLFITSGASMGLSLICTYFTQPGDFVFVEDPSYFLIFSLFRDDHKLKLDSVPIDKEGIIIEELETKLKNGIIPKFLYLQPTFHNPSSWVLSAKRRERLIELASNYNFLIVADEVYHFLSFGDFIPPPPMVVWDYLHSCKYSSSNGSVISVGSFSKLLAPGLRLGYFHVAPTSSHLLKPFRDSGTIKSGGCLNNYASVLLQILISTRKFDEHYEMVRRVYSEKAFMLYSTFIKLFAKDIQENKIWIDQPKGGYFVWIRFNLELVPTAIQFIEELKSHGIIIKKGSICSIKEKSQENAVRLCFAFLKKEEIEKGIIKLNQIWNDFNFKKSKL